MDGDAIAALLGSTTRAMPLRDLLARLGVTAIPAASGGKTESKVELPRHGLVLGLAPVELGGSELFRLTHVGFDASFGGALPAGLAVSDSRIEIVRKLGKKPLGIFGPPLLFDFEDRTVTVELAEKGKGIAEVTVTLRWAFPPEPFRFAWSVLGLSPEAAPANLGLRVAAPLLVDDVAARPVSSGETFAAGEDGRLAPVPGGLFDERIFGPIPRRADGSLDLRSPVGQPLLHFPQAVRFGVIELPIPIVHPWIERHGFAELVKLTRLSARKLRGVLDYELGVAIPQSGDLRLVSAFDDDASDAALVWGAEAIARLAGKWLPAGSILRRLPVLPASLRATQLGPDGALVQNGPTLLYRNLIQAIFEYRAVAEGDSTALLRSMVARPLRNALDAVLAGGLCRVDDEEGGAILMSARSAHPLRDAADLADDPEEDDDEDEGPEDEESEDAEPEDEDDGEDVEDPDADDPEPKSERPVVVVRALLEVLRDPDDPGRAQLADFAARLVAKPSLLSSPSPHDLRSRIAASCLELVLLRDDGEVDEVTDPRRP